MASGQLPADPLDASRHPHPSTCDEALPGARGVPGWSTPARAETSAVPSPAAPGPDLLDPATAAGLGPDLLDPAGAYESWTALYTHPNCERRVAQVCTRLGVRHYLPLLEQWIGPEFTRHRALAPLFPSYVFACASRDELVAALEIGRVARVIRVDRQDLFLDELRQIQRAIEGDAELTLGPALERGDRVRVVHGPLIGVVGLVQGLRRRRSHHRLVLNVSMLGRAVATEVDVRDVEKVGFALDAATPRVATASPYWRAPAEARRVWT